MASDYGCSATHSSSSLGEHTRMLGLRLCLYCSPAQDADQFLSHHIPKCHFACSVLQLQRWEKKSEIQTYLLASKLRWKKMLKKKIHFQNLILRSSYSRRVMSPFGVVQFAIHLIMCSFLHWDFFFFYLVQSHFVVFQPLPSHILCLWLSLDFSQTDKLISFIHTWSFFSFITTSWFFLFFPPWHPSSLPVGWP